MIPKGQRLPVTPQNYLERDIYFGEIRNRTFKVSELLISDYNVKAQRREIRRFNDCTLSLDEGTTFYKLEIKPVGEEKAAYWLYKHETNITYENRSSFSILDPQVLIKVERAEDITQTSKLGLAIEQVMEEMDLYWLEIMKDNK